MRFYTIKPGDTAENISFRFGITVKELLNYNKLTDISAIVPGKTIIIPRSAGFYRPDQITVVTTTAPPTTLIPPTTSAPTPTPIPTLPTPSGFTCPTPTSTPSPTPTSTVPPTITPPGFTCPLLGYDSTGSAVKLLQQRLLASNFNPGPIDGIFGIKTLGALSAFQKNSNLAVTGTTTLATWVALGVECPTPTPSVTPTPSPTTPPGFACPLLGYGSIGDDVKFLQQRLLVMAFNPGPIDGFFGIKTLNALSAFQQNSKLPVTGTTTLATWVALGVECPAPTATATPTPTSTPTPTATPTATPTPTVTPTPTPKPLFLSEWFYVSSAEAWNSLTQNYRLISALIPFWYQVTSLGDVIDNSEGRVLDFAKQHNVPIYGLFHNFTNGRFDPQLIGTILNDSGLRTRLVANILQVVKANGLAGINIDFEFIPPAQRNNFTDFMKELYTTLNGAGYAVTLDVPAKEQDSPNNSYSGAYDYTQLWKYADEIIILTQDEHYLAFPDPGPIASIPWVRRIVDFAISQGMPVAKIKIAIPVYGYDWIRGSTGITVSEPQAIALAQSHNTPLQFDPVSMSPHFTYVDNNGTIHDVWFENGVSFAVKLDLVNDYHLAGFASWRIGLEEPNVWEVLDTYI